MLDKTFGEFCRKGSREKWKGIMSQEIFFFFFNYFNQAYLRDGETDLVEKRMNDVREKEGMITVTKSLSR